MLIFLFLITAKFIMKNCNFREQFVLGCFVNDTLFLFQLNDHFLGFFALLKRSHGLLKKSWVAVVAVQIKKLSQITIETSLR